MVLRVHEMLIQNHSGLCGTFSAMSGSQPFSEALSTDSVSDQNRKFVEDSSRFIPEKESHESAQK